MKVWFIIVEYRCQADSVVKDALNYFEIENILETVGCSCGIEKGKF